MFFGWPPAPGRLQHPGGRAVREWVMSWILIGLLVLGFAACIGGYICADEEDAPAAGYLRGRGR